MFQRTREKITDTIPQGHPFPTVRIRITTQIGAETHPGTIPRHKEIRNVVLGIPVRRIHGIFVRPL